MKESDGITIAVDTYRETETPNGTVSFESLDEIEPRLIITLWRKEGRGAECQWDILSERATLLTEFLGVGGKPVLLRTHITFFKDSGEEE